MFSKGIKTGVLSGGGEDFASHGVRKKGRSLSQTSFLITNNFIHIPQSFEIIDRKKTLAFAPSTKWNQNESPPQKPDDDFSERTSLNYESSQNNFYSGSMAQSSKSNQNLFFVNEDEFQQPKFLHRETDDSQTDLSVYKYNPIFPENQLYPNETEDKISSLTSYTSVKHHILENIPINLISNLNIFLNNGEKYESLVSSKSGICRANNTPSKNNHTSLAISESDINLKDDQTSKAKLGNLNYGAKNHDGVCQQSSHFNNRLNHFENNKVIQDELNSSRLIVLKPASDSALISCSSESMITYGHVGNLVKKTVSSETFSESESTQVDQEENDMHVHYINDSGSDESEYSLLISKGYTFANKLSSKKELERLNYFADVCGNSSVLSDGESNGTAETELHVINFSEYSLNKAGSHRQGDVENEAQFNIQNSGLNPSKLKSINLEHETFKSCNSNSEVKSSVPSNHQLSSFPPFEVVKNKYSGENSAVNSKMQANLMNETEKIKSNDEKMKIRNDQPRNKQNEDRIVLKNENILPKNELEARSLNKGTFIQQNRSIRNTVKKISNRFMSNMCENPYSTDRESTTYSEMSYDTNAVEDECGDTTSERSFSDQSDTTFTQSDYNFRNINEPTDYSDTDYYRESEIIQQSKKPKFFRKEKGRPRNYQDFSSGQSFVSRFKPKIFKKQAKNENRGPKIENMPKKFKKRYNYLTSSASNVAISAKPGYSMYTITSVSTNPPDFDGANFFPRKGSSKNASSKEQKGTNDKQMLKDTIAIQSRTSEKESEFKEVGKKELFHFYDRKENHLHNDRKDFYNSADRKESYNTNGSKEILHHANNRKETYSSNDRKEIYNSSDKKDVYNFNDKKDGINSTSKMEVYSTNDKKEAFHFKDKKEIPVTYSNKFVHNDLKEVSSSCDTKEMFNLNDKREAQFNCVEREILFQCIDKKEPLKTLSAEKKSAFPTIQKKDNYVVEKRDMSTSTEKTDIFYACEKNDSFFVDKKDTYYTSDRKESYALTDKRETSRSNKSLSSVENKTNVINCIFNPRDKILESSTSEHSIGDSTSEYINWAKNCIFSRVNKPSNIAMYSSNQSDITDQNQSSRVSEMGNECEQDKGSDFTMQNNFSPAEDRRMEVASISISQESSQSSVESISSSESVLSVIIEEKDASLEKLKSPHLSKKNSAVIHSSKRENSSHSVQQEQLSLSTKFESYSQDILSDDKEIQTLVKSSKSKSSKSKKLSIVSSDSEEEYTKFKDEMKHYRKHVETHNTPRIIPSWSTFTPDKSCTQLNSTENMC